ncbi:MlaD family protein [Nocardioides sp. GCM10030258]|uniref:MlaD family protein n=1 Tax=unclassified Nocardioides TaxID=2615069 RepID=UPI0036205733
MKRLASMPKPVAGAMVIFLVVMTTAMIYNKERIGTDLRRILTSTDTVYAEFSIQPKVREFRAGSDVKLAGIKVGTVRGIEAIEDGRSRVTMQLDGGTRDKLGSEPTATVRATLVLGGRYYIDLAPGGGGSFDADTIPVERTSLPVEVGDVLHAVGSKRAQLGIQSSIRQLDAALDDKGEQALRGLVKSAPATLEPGAQVLEGLRGTSPKSDLTNTVRGLRNTATAMTKRDGQVESLIAAVDDGTRALADASEPLAEAVATMPETLRTTRTGLRDLQPTLDQTITTAEDLGPSAEALKPLTENLDPVLIQSRRFMAVLKPLLIDTQPLLERLAPAASKGTKLFDNLNGPVLERVNGPITKAVNSPFKGTGRYAGNGNSGNLLYEELSYLGVWGSQDFGWHDKNGAVARVGPTVGLGSFGALVPSTEQLLEQLGLQLPLGPQASAGN